MAIPAGLEPATSRLGILRSILMSYGTLGAINNTSIMIYQITSPTSLASWDDFIAAFFGLVIGDFIREAIGEGLESRFIF